MPVTKIEITSRQPFAGGKSFGDTGAYEQLDGTVHFAVNPVHPVNETITDVELAPHDSEGAVAFSADFRVLRPVDPKRGNGRALFDILNRGKPLALRNINSAPEVPPDGPMDPGNGFLMREGYTVAWCGWQHDVPDTPGLMRIHVPDAPVSGKIVVTFQPNVPTEVQYLSDRGHRAYPADNLEDWNSLLTVQEHEDSPERVIPRQEWWFARLEDGRRIPDASHVCYPDGFQPGSVYQVVYTTTGAPVAGLGLAATRDFASFLRYGGAEDGNPAQGVVKVYAFGVSQSGRFLRQFLYQGINYDEAGRSVFDGFIPHVAGGKRGEFNQRFAQPSSQAARSTNSIFPFTDTAQTDPETGLTDGILSRLAAQGPLPKVMYTYTPSEYWAGHGSLAHTTLDAKADVTPPDDVRIYVFASTQHGLGSFPLVDLDAVDNYHGQHSFNGLDYRPLLRAALTNLDRWVTNGEVPPPSRHPRIGDGTAVTPTEAGKTLERIPGVKIPAPLRRFARLDFGPNPMTPTVIPAAVGAEFPGLVSAVDQDGNEASGIPLPFITAPLATHMGWNTRQEDIGGGGQILSTGGASGGTVRGATIPFPATKEEREASGDPRLSIEERYGSKDEYLRRIEEAARRLIDEGYMLEEDLEPVTTQAAQQYDLLRGRVAETQPVS
jgi:hypothetical protein